MKKKATVLLFHCLLIYHGAKAQIPNDDGSWNSNLTENFNYTSTSDATFNQRWQIGYSWGRVISVNQPDAIEPYNVSFSSGILDLKIQLDQGMHGTYLAQDVNGNWYWEQEYFNYSSGLIQSRDSYLFGYFEGAIKAPDGLGFHGGFWLFGAGCDQNVNFYEEVDIFEPDGSHNPFTAFPSNYHWETTSVCNQEGRDAKPVVHTGLPNLSTAYHKYALEWAPNYLIWYFNDEPIRFEIDLENIPQHAQVIINGCGLSQYYGPYRSGATSTNLPSSWKTDHIKHYSADIRISSNPIFTSTSNLNTYTSDPHVAKTIKWSPASMMTVNTSNKITLRSSDNVTIDKNFTVNPNGSGHFTILVPDYN